MEDLEYLAEAQTESMATDLHEWAVERGFPRELPVEVLVCTAVYLAHQVIFPPAGEEYVDFVDVFTEAVAVTLNHLTSLTQEGAA